DADRLGTMLLADRAQALRRPGEGLVPADRLEAAVGALAQRRPDAVRILVHRLHRIGLRTEIAAAAEIVGVPVDADDLLLRAIDMDAQAAAGLAGGAGSTDDLDRHDGLLGDATDGRPTGRTDGERWTTA